MTPVFATYGKGDRDRVKKSLASFGRDSVSAGPSGVPYMFLHFPEGDTLNRDTLASSLEFAKREVGAGGAWCGVGTQGPSLSSAVWRHRMNRYRRRNFTAVRRADAAVVLVRLPPVLRKMNDNLNFPALPARRYAWI